MPSKHVLCDCPAGLAAPAERHAPDCPGRYKREEPVKQFLTPEGLARSEHMERLRAQEKINAHQEQQVQRRNEMAYKIPEEISRVQHPGHVPAEEVVKLKPDNGLGKTLKALTTEPTCYMSGRYRDVIAGRAHAPIGVEVSFANFNWPDQIELFTADKLVAHLLPSGKGVAISVEQLQKIQRELDACQKVIHYAGGFDPAYVEDAQAALKVIEDILKMVGKQ